MRRFAAFTAVLAAVVFCAVVISRATTSAAAGGTVSGTVKYGGAPPPAKKLDITKDKNVCALKPHFDESLAVASDGGVQYAVVLLKDVKGAKPATVDYDQKGCSYAPRVIAFAAGSKVNIKNDDGILHNIHSYSTKNPPFNLAQPKFKKVMTVEVKQPEIIRVTCDAHGWMKGWWYVTDSPYFAVTDAKGNFTIKDVPPGDYTIEVWQEKLGTENQKVKVKAGDTAKADFTLKPKS
ncbi:MAG: carboxypeptidase regulatory-like domain-containing protein [Candidatus Binataceae bacterium]